MRLKRSPYEICQVSGAKRLRLYTSIALDDRHVFFQEKSTLGDFFRLNVNSDARIKYFSMKFELIVPKIVQMAED